MSQAKQAALQNSAVRQQTEKILAHGLFARSERMGRFLRFAVEQSLQGKSAELKEYLIGVEVFDRGPEYDPRVDPIVRVEARRLRSKLKAYYDGDGREDPILIDLPSGAYAPHVCARVETPLASRTEAAPVTIAVLPFVNLSGNPDNEYLSDGITEELIHSLTRLGGMRVVAWSSAARLRGRQEDILAIRHQLNASAALTGSVRIAGANLRVRVQLIDTETGVYLWSETFDRQMQDVFAIQEEIALAIVRTLRIQFAAGPGAILAGRGRTTVSAYDWCLKGRYCWHRRSPDDLARSVQCFENAIAADPNSALGHAGLADTYSLLADYGLVHPSKSMPKAEAAAARAIALDPELAEAHVSLAFIRGVYYWEWEDAERLYHRAIALNPGYATAHHWLGMDHCSILGRFDEALTHVDHAAQLDPLSSIIQEGRAYIMMLMRRYEDAIACYRTVIASDPSFFKAYTSLGRALALQGNYAEALSMLLKGRKLAGDIPSILAASGQIYALAGDTERARALLAELEQQATHAYVPSTCFALIHVGLGNTERALQWLERGCDEREMPVTSLKVHPVYDPLRGEPRFQMLLKRLRFE